MESSANGLTGVQEAALAHLADAGAMLLAWREVLRQPHGAEGCRLHGGRG